MTTISFKDFSQGGVVQTVGNEAAVQQQEQSSGPSFFQKLQDTASQTVNNIKDVVNSDSGLPSKAIQVTGNIAQGGLNAVGDAISSTPVVKDVVKAVAEPISAGIKATQDWIANNPSVQKAVSNETSNAIASFLDQHPDIAKNAEAVNSIANAILVAKGSLETAGTVKNLATKAVDSVPGVVKPVVDTAKSVVQKVTPESTAIMQRVARIPKGEQVKFENIAGESVGSFLDRTGNYGPIDQIVEKLYKDFTQSKANADNALETLQGTYRATPVRTALSELEGKMQRTSSPGAPDPELSRVTQLANKEKTTGLTMSEINEVKRIFERRVRLDYMKEGTSQDSIQRATNIDKAVHDWQMAEADKAGLTNLQEINKSTQINKQLMDALGKENAGVGGNNALGLTDAILVAGGSPQAIASLLVKKTFSDKGVQSFVAKKLSKNKVKIGVPEAQFKEKLQLPAPKTDVQESNNVPIKLNKESASTISKREVANNSKKKVVSSFERAKGLSPENKAVEDKAFAKIVSSEDKLLAEYKAKHGKEINTDNFRPLFKKEGYSGANAAAVQEPASYLAKKAYADALTNDGKYATFSSGGSGVGKSTGIKSIPELTNLIGDSAAVFDSNLSSYSSAIKKIEQAQQAGKKFEGIYTYRDPVDSLVNGVIKRMRDNPEEMGRIVPTKVMADNHINSLAVAKKLSNEGYNFRIVDNSLGQGKARLSTLKDIESKAKYPSVQELTSILNKKVKELYDRGELTPEQYKEYTN